mmetsp:Transcript_94222/g.162939  ORF Transcript_94222/g.162939 Transcript_94222/m.162939 type:complete len:164 (+) Transcript_94222:971-1462(+)
MAPETPYPVDAELDVTPSHVPPGLGPRIFTLQIPSAWGCAPLEALRRAVTQQPPCLPKGQQACKAEATVLYGQDAMDRRGASPLGSFSRPSKRASVGTGTRWREGKTSWDTGRRGLCLRDDSYGLGVQGMQKAGTRNRCLGRKLAHAIPLDLRLLAFHVTVLK